MEQRRDSRRDDGEEGRRLGLKGFVRSCFSLSDLWKFFLGDRSNHAAELKNPLPTTMLWIRLVVRARHPWKCDSREIIIYAARVGIVSPWQAENNKSVDMMMLARRKEWVYYDTSPNYGRLASKMGSEYLAKLLSKTISIHERAIEKLKLLNEVLVVAEENVVRRQELIKSSYADWVMRRSLRTCIKNLFGSDGVTRSSEAGESCRRKNSVSGTSDLKIAFGVACG
ncbi:hypothetical protein F2Q69_00020245 [Brassica cretica]|uniref:Uncharacterized protein n=1 Tax=Brassica cretica TaxID=69181 RepID=A0A8S9Q0R9_BRACR|nr:hypothetical protein F2Q69_00020245 [Brassica cretica]